MSCACSVGAACGAQECNCVACAQERAQTMYRVASRESARTSVRRAPAGASGVGAVGRRSAGRRHVEPPLGPGDLRPPEWWLAAIDANLAGAQFGDAGEGVEAAYATLGADGVGPLGDSALSDTVRLGANAWAGQAFTDPEDCGYVFQGYALPLHDPPANRALERSYCSPSSALGYHVNTASTHTVKVDGRWRMYIPEPRVKADAPSATTDVYPWPRYLPSLDATAPEIERYPDTWSERSERFSPNYISFVDSPDGGLTFPVYAPVVPPRAFDATGCISEFATELASWSQAGWTPTAIPSRNEATDGAVDGIYTIYRDPSVIDLSASHGIYLMIVVECRSTTATLAEVITCHPCIHSAGENCDTYAYTRIVVFTSASPDFPNVSAPDGTWPDPKNWTRAAVLLDGGGDPVTGTIPDEHYGVPSVTLSSDGANLLVYVGIGNPDTTNETWVQRRIAYHYIERPPALSRGLSCFAISISNFAYTLTEIRYWDRLGSDAFAADARSRLETLTENGYEGEVILSTGELDLRNNFEQLQNLDPQFTLIAGEVWAHFVAVDSPECPDASPEPGNDCSSEVHQIRRARAVTVAPTATSPRGFSPAAYNKLADPEFFATPQTPFALFLRPERCFKLLDMKAITGTAGFGLTRDPDVAELDDGTIRISFAGSSSEAEGANIGQGLMFATHVPAIRVGQPEFIRRPFR